MGRLGGIARHGRSRGPIETLHHVSVTREQGVRGDLRGAVRPGKTGRRQISLMEAESWESALQELGPGTTGKSLPWHVRRANLLVEGIRLPREAGKVIAIGATLRIEVTCECDPCSRMDEIHPDLKLALMPDWRGGVLGRVLTDGEIAVGDEVRIEE
ncbi:MAG: MOSC domain-containing protein [Novosphingobium sp.]|nr:MOSC domain-containing protein [Novosphingobium sp.]